MGQGNRAGPAIWAVVSSVIIQVMRQHTGGTKLVSPMSRNPTSFVGFSFMDDSDLTIANTEQYQTSGQILSQLQTAVSEWEDALQVTGGSLAPQKSYWTPIVFSTKPGQATYDGEAKAGAQLWMTDKRDTISLLGRVSIH